MQYGCLHNVAQQTLTNNLEKSGLFKYHAFFPDIPYTRISNEKPALKRCTATFALSNC